MPSSKINQKLMPELLRTTDTERRKRRNLREGERDTAIILMWLLQGRSCRVGDFAV